MAGVPRPTSGLGSKKYGMKPPSTRPTTTRSQTNTTAHQQRAQSGAVSPADSQLSLSTTASHAKPSPRGNAGVKRKERDYDAETAEETNIHVVVRCRGRSDREVRENSHVVVSTGGVKGQNVELSMGPSALSNKTYRFDKVFSPAADQSMIYDEVVTPILEEMLAGYNCTIFAYGQTGTGKTYTMSGDMSDTLGLISDSAGIIPRVLNSLFRKLDNEEGESSVKCSFIELYNEELRDLLSPDDSTKLKIYEDGQKKGHAFTMVQGMEESHIKTAADGIQLLQNGSHKRQVAATKCNDLSSRSHTVFTVTAYIKRATEAGEDFVSAGKLNLVDLAGSENIQRSGAENKRAAEAGLINKSLLTLGRVINALVERSSHIPYRESKLTRLLQDSLGGRTKTCIIATVSPAKSNLEETISTLDYAFRAKNIKNKPQINSLISKKTLLKEFTAEIEKLKGELIATRQRNGVYMTAEGYDEIMEQNESRRILCDDQRERIETMEVSLRNKAQELFNLTNTFTLVKKNFEGTKQSLEDTKGILEKTEFILADTRQNLADETLLRKAHESTEEMLSKNGKDLISTLEQTIGDVEGLHSKIQRKNDLDDSHRSDWQMLQDEVARSTDIVQGRLLGFRQQQEHLVAQLSARMDSFVADELDKASSSQELIQSKISALEMNKKEMTEKSSATKEEMDSVIDELKNIESEIKDKINNGLKGLSTAAGRISAEVVSELDHFHTQLHSSYSSLGKEFKGVFDELAKHMQVQRSEVESMKEKMSAASRTAMLSNDEINSKLDAFMREERQKAEQERQSLISQIGLLINKQGEEQDKRRELGVQDIQKHLSDSRSKVELADSTYNHEMESWVQKEKVFADEMLQSRDVLKLRLKDDWKSINERNNSIQSTAKSVHEESICLVDAQMVEIEKQMRALDDFVQQAHSQNSSNHQVHAQSLERLASNVQGSYTSIGNNFEGSYARIKDLGTEIFNQADGIRATLPKLSPEVQQPLTDLRTTISQTTLREYVPLGETPQRRMYTYPKNMPRTESHDALLGRDKPDQPLSSTTPPKSPSKTLIYTDPPPTSVAALAASTSPSKDRPSTATGGLREISLNVHAAPGVLTRNNSDSMAISSIVSSVGKVAADGENIHVGGSMAPPPLKRQATEGSKLPTTNRFGDRSGKGAGGGGGMVRLEGRENLGASLGSSIGAGGGGGNERGVGGRRLRSSPNTAAAAGGNEHK